MNNFQFRVASRPVIPNQPFGHTTGLLGTFAFDLHRENDIHKLGGFFDRKQGHASADGRTRPQRRRKTKTIQSIVDAHPNSPSNANRLSAKIANQRKREEAVSDGAAVGRFTRRSLWINVYPLPVFRGFRELLDAVLGQHQPVRRRQFTAFEFF